MARHLEYQAGLKEDLKGTSVFYAKKQTFVREQIIMRQSKNNQGSNAPNPGQQKENGTLRRNQAKQMDPSLPQPSL